MVKPRFTEDFPGGVVREGADELTQGGHEEGVVRSFTDTTNVANERWAPPLVGEDWHAICQAIHKGAEWEAMYYQYTKLHQAVKSTKSNEEKPKYSGLD